MELERSEDCIRNRVSQNSADRCDCAGALSTKERVELQRLRREDRQLKLAWDILARAAGGLYGIRG